MSMTTIPDGLTDAEAAACVASQGPNELPASRKRTIVTLLLDVLREPMILLLCASGGVYLILGDLREAIALLASIVVVVGISLVQSQKTERALDALREFASPRALVVRGGVEKRIAGRDVVEGDLVRLAEGDRVPADGVVLESGNLTVDESLLTGESVPVRKVEGLEADALAPPGGDDTPRVFSGTLVVSGHGLARIKATGPRTALGRIGRALDVIAPEKTPLQRETARLVRVLAVAGITACLAVVVLYGALRGSWMQGLLAGLALALSLLPEEFPVILTVFLALGAWRLSRRNVLTRRMPALEALGSISVLCVDKTGTLTANRMSVGILSVDGRRWDASRQGGEPLPEEFHELLEFALLASQKATFDPMDLAILTLGQSALGGTEHLHEQWELAREYPLTRSILAISHAWRAREAGTHVVATKGAPEAIADLCHLDEASARAMIKETGALADEGFRVLGVARASFPSTALPDGPHDFEFHLVGLVALADPLREGVESTVAECERAGIRTVMITGDYAGTARKIAGEIGLPAEGHLVTGPELDSMDDAALAERLRGVRVFARTVPEQKLRLVQAFRAGGEVVAMTGDGVNDAPALRAADIGIAMGQRGTDVAREAAALVVLDDDFSSIVAGIRLGRRVSDNIRKAMSYVLSIHVPIATVSLVPVLLDWPLLLMPIHIVFLELIIDPACSVAFESEPEEDDVMRRPPRDPREPALKQWRIGMSLVRGLFASLVVLGVVAWGVSRHLPETETRCLAFSAFVLLNLGLILSSRSATRTAVASLRMPNLALWWVVGSAFVLLFAVQAVPAAREVFRFAPLSALELLLLAVLFTIGVAGFDAIKLVDLARIRGRERRESGTPANPGL
jgi:P-type Ca2+ transporter type 2C